MKLGLACSTARNVLRGQPDLKTAAVKAIVKSLTGVLLDGRTVNGERRRAYRQIATRIAA